MKYFLSFILVTVINLSGYSQKVVSQIFDAGEISEIVINADEVYRIKISTTGGKQVTLRTISEGEYYNDISLDVEMQQNKMILSSNFPEILQGGFDKLSAHKVFSVEVELEIPKNLDVLINSNIASVIAGGDYENLHILLKSGYCKMNNFSGNAIINTYSGHVEISTNNAVIEANSRSGSVSLPAATPGKNLIRIQSNTGDIKVRKN